MVGILHMESEVNKKFIETMKKKIFNNWVLSKNKYERTGTLLNSKKEIFHKKIKQKNVKSILKINNNKKHELITKEK